MKFDPMGNTHRAEKSRSQTFPSPVSCAHRSQAAEVRATVRESMSAAAGWLHKAEVYAARLSP